MLRHVIQGKPDTSKLFPDQGKTYEIVPTGRSIRQLVEQVRHERHKFGTAKITTQLEFQEFRLKLKFRPGIYVAHHYHYGMVQDPRDICYCLYIENVLANIKQTSSMGYPEACIMMPLIPPKDHPEGQIYFFQESGFHRRTITTEEFSRHINDSVQDYFEGVVKSLSKQGISCVAPDRGWKGYNPEKGNS